MTTIIACRSLAQMVADSRIDLEGGAAFKNTRKIAKCGQFVAGVAGDIGPCLGYREAFKARARSASGLKPPPKLDPMMEGVETELIVMSKHGIWVYGEDGSPIEIEEEFYAIGSGAAWAMACLETQERLMTPYNLEMAMEIACENDKGSGLPMVSIKL